MRPTTIFHLSKQKPPKSSSPAPLPPGSWRVSHQTVPGASCSESFSSNKLRAESPRRGDHRSPQTLQVAGASRTRPCPEHPAPSLSFPGGRKGWPVIESRKKHPPGNSLQPLICHQPTKSSPLPNHQSSIKNHQFTPSSPSTIHSKPSTLPNTSHLLTTPPNLINSPP